MEHPMGAKEFDRWLDVQLAEPAPEDLLARRLPQGKLPTGSSDEKGFWRSLFDRFWNK